MQIVIDIPNWLYDDIRNKKDGVNSPELYWAIYNGTPLPEHHGRLIDADALYSSLMFPSQQFANAYKETLDDAPTIIEATEEVN